MALGLGHLQQSRGHLHSIFFGGRQQLQIVDGHRSAGKTTDPALSRPSIFVPPDHPPATLVTQNGGKKLIDGPRPPL